MKNMGRTLAFYHTHTHRVPTCVHLSPASMTAKSDESMQSGTQAMSGSDAIRLQKWVMACSSNQLELPFFKHQIEVKKSF